MNIERAPQSRDEMSYSDALLYCTFCNHNDHMDWRLPTRDEWAYLEIYNNWYLNDSGVGNDYATPVRDI